MDCHWGKTDCMYQGEKCHLCIMEEQHYKSSKKKPSYKRAKETRRAGSKFEAKNSNLNNDILIASKPTPNSGAGKIKGDEQIKGYLRIMEELKEQNSLTAKGTKTFTIHKEWLTKLEHEAQIENMEFYYLKFVFGTEDALNNDYYVIVDGDILMSMVKTLWEDRKIANQAQSQIDLACKRKEVVEAENIYLKAQLDLLQVELKQAINKQ